MRSILCVLAFLFVSCSVFSGETKPREDLKEKIKPVMESLQEKREQQHKENMEWLKGELEKIDLPEDVKKKVLERIKERREKMREKHQQMRQNHMERRKERGGKK
jgi:regulator of protease activity HflC (stomatin/prohibitin superfamily)